MRRNLSSDDPHFGFRRDSESCATFEDRLGRVIDDARWSHDFDLTGVDRTGVLAFGNTERRVISTVLAVLRDGLAVNADVCGHELEYN